MKNLLFLALIFLSACRHEEETNPLPYDDATIINFDARLCPCCGGWFIEINDTTWRFQNQPATSDVDLNVHVYPIPVKVIWNRKVNPCLNDEIEVSWLMKR